MEFKKSFNNFFQIILLILLCVFSAFLISYPLWLFSVKLPSIYSVFFLILISAAAVYLIVKAFKKYSFFRTLRIVIFLLVIALSLYGIFTLVINGFRVPALIIFILVFPVEMAYMKITGKILNEKK